LADGVLVLDPPISYEGMKLDYAGDAMLSAYYLESSKTNLYQYYKINYADKCSALMQVTVPGPSADASSAPPHSPQMIFFYFALSAEGKGSR
jgi:hypothetical protein